MAIRKRKKKCGVHTILVTPAKEGHIAWEYAPEGSGRLRGGYVSVTTDNNWLYVSTDDSEGTAMFPKALLKEVLRELRECAKREHPSP